MMSKVIATAQTQEERSTSVVVPFSSIWHDAIVAGLVRTVIRKRFPSSTLVESMYFYVNSPRSAIVGRARVTTLRRISRNEAVSLSDELLLSPEDVDKYLGVSDTVGLFTLEGIVTAKQPLTLATLQSNLVFHPPQGYLILSKAALNLVEQLGRFGSQNTEVTR